MIIMPAGARINDALRKNSNKQNEMKGHRSSKK
jgi:hypothetical protein